MIIIHSQEERHNALGKNDSITRAVCRHYIVFRDIVRAFLLQLFGEYRNSLYLCTRFIYIRKERKYYEPMIEIRDLHKSFDDQEVLKGITTSFHPGVNNLIIGQSGSGKTVLLKCLIGLYKPEIGEIRYDGRDVTQFKEKEMKAFRKEIGVLFQGSALFDSMSVAENVAFPLRMFSEMTEAEIMERVDFCLERVELQGAHEKMPSQISGGMQKRVAIARAIALNPKYLFCDEPNSGLDPQTSIVIDQLINDITREYNITTVVNTHDMNSVLGIGDHITFLSGGQVAWTGNKDNILQQNECESLHRFLYAAPTLQRIRL